MPKKLTRERLRQIIREEKRKLDKNGGSINEASEEELQRELTKQLDRLKQNMDRHAVGDIANEASYKLTEGGMEKFIRKVKHTNAQIRQAIEL